MKNQESTEVELQKQMFIKLIVSAWETQNTRVSKLIGELADEELMAETAPSRNTGIYILGHLIAVSDGMLPLLGFRERLYPELTAVFLTNPDKTGHQMPSISDLRLYWNAVNLELANYFNEMQPEQWLAKHTAISEEDFAREPHRNKLNILINRSNHQAYHLGQLIYLKKK